MSRKSALANAGAPVALPKESYWVGNYQGYEDNEFHWSTPKSKTGSPVTFGSLVHDAKANAAKHDVPFPAGLGRPGVRERLHKSGSKFEDHSAKSEPEVSGNAVVKPEGLYSGPEYAARPKAQWIIPGVLQEASYSIASGRSQAGKSFCELALSLSVVTGEPWLGEPVEKTGPVLYVAAEGQGRIWKDVLAWYAKFDVDPESLRGQFFIYDRSARLNIKAGREVLAKIWSYIEHVTGRLPILVVFDTLRRNMRGGVSQEEPTSDVLHAVNELQAAGIAVTLVAHHGRGHDETKGLTEWEDDADQVRIYHGTVRDGTTEIEFKKVKSSEDGWSIAVKYTKHKLPDGATTLVAATGKRKEGEKSDTEKYADYDALAIQILGGLADPFAKRGALAKAVINEVFPEMCEDDPRTFDREWRTYGGHLARINPIHPLWPYVDQKNDSGQPLTFRNPKNRGRRDAKPGRHKMLNYTLPNRADSED